ncbi:MAG: hypothetical protein ACI9JN_001834 [Bacteroidia bacterium]|jgi:hypothetical protein
MSKVVSLPIFIQYMSSDYRLILFCSIALGIVLFVLSIAYRRRYKLRRLFLNFGIVFGLLPILLYIALSLFLFIKERPHVGNYEGDTGVQGIASLDVFDDNTFILKSDSCTTGFVQGTWSYHWSGKRLELISTSQRMGDIEIINQDSLVFRNIPVCIKLVREMTLVRSGKPLIVPMEELER